MSAHRFLYRPPPKNHPLFTRCRISPSVASLPPAVDLRPFMLPPRDQGGEGCCSGFSTAALREGLRSIALKTTAQTQQLSPAYLYARTRMAEGTFPQDAGATIADEMTTLENYGACPESVLPYSGNASEGPTPAADVQAVPFRCGTPQLLNRGGQVAAIDVQASLASNQPVVFGMQLQQSFESTGADGIVPTPGPTSTDPVLGGHAMLCVGYDQATQRFTIRNSWSASWGAAGYCYMPFGMLVAWFEAWTAPIAT